MASSRSSGSSSRSSSESSEVPDATTTTKGKGKGKAPAKPKATGKAPTAAGKKRNGAQTERAAEKKRRLEERANRAAPLAPEVPIPNIHSDFRLGHQVPFNPDILKLPNLGCGGVLGATIKKTEGEKKIVRVVFTYVDQVSYPPGHARTPMQQGGALFRLSNP